MLKPILITIFAIVICTVNYAILMEYFHNYVPEYFDVVKILDKKYRCIRYFDDREYDKFIDSQCQPYVYDYLLFKLEKSRYIYIHYAYNFIMWGLFGLVYLI